ncbi:MAG: group II truncated hemoglobin [Deltaproteobacteria bacterium]|jgi:hemoglobin|nr:group II truncated hemoglobin [Deltaproteobacteria bacterium]MBW2497361.1 group II truncated hemoglobin [Deltaproteobacteria bacterium]
MSEAMDPYRELGGEAGVRALVDRFYDRMVSDPEAALIREMHAADLRKMRERLALFLCGWLGGPPLYDERFGHLCMRTAHEPFPIGIEARDQWMSCMEHALAEAELPVELQDALIAAFTRVCEMLRNLPEDAERPTKVRRATSA